MMGLWLSGCQRQLRLPKERVETEYLLPYPLEQVREACPSVLARFLGQVTEVNIPPYEVYNTYRTQLRPGSTPWDRPLARSSMITIGQTSDGTLTVCSVTTGSGTTEHWNVLAARSGTGTVLRIHRHLRSKVVGVPITDGSKEEAFVDAMSKALSRR